MWLGRHYVQVLEAILSMIYEVHMITQKIKRLSRYLRHCSSRLYPHLYALSGYALLTLLFTYPMVLNIGSKLIGIGGDGWQMVWNLWWTKKALLDLHANPFYTTYLYHPQGVSLYFHTLNIFNGLLSIPLQGVFGLIFSYNAIVLFSFVFGGYGAYLLTHYLVKNRTAAFISGMVFTFSPYHLAHTLGHLNLIALEWLPFYVLFLIRTVEEKSYRNALYAAFFLCLTSLCDWHYVMYLFLFTCIAAVYYLLCAESAKAARNIVIKLVLVGIIFAILDAPILVPMVKEASREDYIVPSLDDSIVFSADFLSFFVPTNFHPLWGQRAGVWREKFTGGLENIVFVGYTVLVLGLLGGWREWPKRTFWLCSLLFFFVMALGPVLHINGKTRFTDHQLLIVLPYALFYRYIPFARVARSVARMSVMVMLSLAVLVGFGLAWLFGKTEHRRLGKLTLSNICACIAIVLIGFEFLPIPFPMAQPPIIPSFCRYIAGEQDGYAILDIPNATKAGNPGHYVRYMFYQTVHNKRIFEGYVARTPSYPLLDSPVVQYLINLKRKQPPDIIRCLDSSTLAHLGFRYIVVHKDSLSTDDYMAFRKRMENLFPKSATQKAGEALGLTFSDSPFWEDDEVLVYRIEEGKSLLASRPSPRFAMSVNFANKVEFLGYDLTRGEKRPDATKFYISYYWKCLEEMEEDYMIFVHITDHEGKKTVSQQDHEPVHGQYPTSRWGKGEIVKETYSLLIPKQVPKGVYSLRIGFYKPELGRLKVLWSDRYPTDDSGTRALIGSLEIR